MCEVTFDGGHTMTLKEAVKRGYVSAIHADAMGKLVADMANRPQIIAIGAMFSVEPTPSSCDNARAVLDRCRQRVTGEQEPRVRECTVGEAVRIDVDGRPLLDTSDVDGTIDCPWCGYACIDGDLSEYECELGSADTIDIECCHCGRAVTLEANRSTNWRCYPTERGQSCR